jgi:hypothetical protein
VRRYTSLSVEITGATITVAMATAGHFQTNKTDSNSKRMSSCYTSIDSSGDALSAVF